MATKGCSTQVAETSQAGASVQDQKFVKETAAENEEVEKGKPSGTAEQTEMYEKREQELKQPYKTKYEKMELDLREKLGELVQEINNFKTEEKIKKSNTSAFLPPDKNKEPDKGMPSGTAEQTEMNEKREEEEEERKSEKMEQDLREKLGTLEQEINDYKTEVTRKKSDSSELSTTMAETSQAGVSVQDQDSGKEMGVENEEVENGKPSGTAELIETYEKREEELKQPYKTKYEKMELDLREKLGELKQEINYYKTRRTMERRSSSEYLPPSMPGTSKGRAALQHLLFNEPFWVVMMAFFGALVGAIVGATDGVQGSAGGVIFGSTIGVLLSILYIRLTRLL